MKELFKKFFANVDIVAEHFVLLFFFIYGLFFMVIDIKILFVLLMFILAYYLFKNKKITMGIREILIVIFSVVMAYMIHKRVIKSFDLFYESLIVCGIAVLSFVIPRIATESKTPVGADYGQKVYISFSTGLFFQGFLSFGREILKWEERDTEMLRSIWKEGGIIRTQAEIWLIFSGSMLFIAVYSLYKKRELFGFVLLFMSIVSLLLEFFEEGRIVLFALIIISVLLFLNNLILYMDVKKSVIFIVVCILVVSMMYILFINNIFGIYDMFNSTYLAGSGGIIHNVRFNYMWSTIKEIPMYPWGGNDTVHYVGTSHSSCAHNMWLDIIKNYGLVPGFLIITYSLIAISDALKMWFSKNIGLDEKLLYIPAFIAMYIYYMIEPVYIASSQYWFPGLVLSGIIFARIRVGKKTKN